MTPPHHEALDVKTDAELLARYDHMRKHIGESAYYDREARRAREALLTRMGRRTPHRLKKSDPMCICENGGTNATCPVHRAHGAPACTCEREPGSLRIRRCPVHGHDYP